jgi:hypothetical protein
MATSMHIAQQYVQPLWSASQPPSLLDLGPSLAIIIIIITIIIIEKEEAGGLVSSDC